MRLVPDSNSGKVGFYRSRMGAWLEHASAIGLSSEMVAAIQADLDAADAALRAQRAAQSAARAATLHASLAIETLCRNGSALIQLIRCEGDRSGGEVFSLARIPLPSKKRTPIGPPSTPSAFTTDLLSNGWLKLDWKCTTPRGAGGTIYYVSRQLNGSGTFEQMDVVGKKSFVDKTIPPGTVSVMYKVLPRRSTSIGQAALHGVSLGSNFNPPEYQSVGRAA